MKHEDLEKLEFESLQAEKQNRINVRPQVWSLFFGLVSAFGLASLQTNAISYLVALYPLLAMCLARYSSHNEAVLDQIKSYLVEIEQRSGYQGYEQYNVGRRDKRKSGGHLQALRDALLLTDVLAAAIVTGRMFVDHLPYVIVFVVVVGEAVAVIATIQNLRDKPKKSELSKEEKDEQATQQAI